MQYQERPPVRTPALEGSKRVEPINGRIPRPYSRGFGVPARPLSRGYVIPGRPYSRGMFAPGRPLSRELVFSGRPYSRGLGYYPRPLPPIQTRVVVPRSRYMGPASLMPWWGGYAVGNHYYPGPKVVPVPVYMKKPQIIPQRIRRPKKTNLSNRPSSVFLFGIILKEIVAALHRIYLNPNGNIYPVLSDIIGPNCYDLGALLHGPALDQKEWNVLRQELQYVIENVIYHITEIMPSAGVLGTHRKSAVTELIRNGKRFPDGYFWQVEIERLNFTEQGRTHNNGDYECFLLIVGIFISRSLVTTLLMKPTDYGLSSTPLSDVAERNLRIVASTLLFLARKISQSRVMEMMDMPQEIAKYLYDDNEMRKVYNELRETFNYCEGLMREWGTEYVRRIRACTGQELF